MKLIFSLERSWGSAAAPQLWVRRMKERDQWQNGGTLDGIEARMCVGTRESLPLSLPKRTATRLFLGSVAILVVASVVGGAVAQTQKGSPAVKPTPIASPPVQETIKPPVKTETTSFDNWRVVCDNQGSSPGARHCVVAQMSVVRAETKQLLVILSVYRDKAAQWKFDVRTPTPLVLGSGVQIVVGKNPARRLSYVSCEQAMCVAEAPLDETLLRELRPEEESAVTFTSLENGEVKVQFPIKGAKAALEELMRP